LLVKVERNGPFIYYELADRRIVSILKDLASLGKELLANRKTFWPRRWLSEYESPWTVTQ
jgi:ArsR family transcriptional regulator, zinc-responsive transcriptional repressor